MPNNTSPFSPWTVLDRQKVFSARPWLQLFREKVRLPAGQIVDDFYQMELPDFVVVFAELPDGRIIALRQYKHGAGKVSLTLPSGMVETGENPRHAARRELLEETGFAATDWRHLGSFTVNGNLGCGRGHYYAASNARFICAPCSGDLEEMEIVFKSPVQIKNALQTGDVALLNHAAAIGLAFLKS